MRESRTVKCPHCDIVPGCVVGPRWWIMMWSGALQLPIQDTSNTDAICCLPIRLIIGANTDCKIAFPLHSSHIASMDHALCSQITQPPITFRIQISRSWSFHTPQENVTAGRGFTQRIRGISRASLAWGIASLVLLNSSSIDRDLATNPQPCPCSTDLELDNDCMS
jgi:hypothetical protein